MIKQRIYFQHFSDDEINGCKDFTTPTHCLIARNSSRFSSKRSARQTFFFSSPNILMPLDIFFWSGGIKIRKQQKLIWIFFFLSNIFIDLYFYTFFVHRINSLFVFTFPCSVMYKRTASMYKGTIQIIPNIFTQRLRLFIALRARKINSTAEKFISMHGEIKFNRHDNSKLCVWCQTNKVQLIFHQSGDSWFTGTQLCRAFVYEQKNFTEL